MKPDPVHDLKGQVRATIDREGLLPAGAAVLVAVSGGADSLTLLHLLCALAPERGWQLRAATFDHAWRPASAADAAAVAAYAEGLGLSCVLGRAAQPARDEAAARAQRLQFLRRAASAWRAEALIALGHSADDRAETLLLNLLRGAGLTGLGAMAPRAGRLVRPLIDGRRADIARYALDHDLPVRLDPTNLDPHFARNRLRLELMPLLEDLRPGATQALARAAAVCGLEREALERYAAGLLEPRLVTPPPGSFVADLNLLTLDLAGWAELPRAERGLILRQALRRARGHLDEVDLGLIQRLDDLAIGSPDRGPLPAAARWGPRLLLGELPAYTSWGPVALGLDSPTPLPALGLTVWVGEGAKECPVRAVIRPGPELALRSRRPGDRLRPAGRGGSRMVADLLAEYGVPAPARDRVPLVVAGEQIVWLPGGPPDEAWAAASGLPLGVEFGVVS
jgi:tRNA(Ile)-lysidine synthase